MKIFLFCLLVLISSCNKGSGGGSDESERQPATDDTEFVTSPGSTTGSGSNSDAGSSTGTTNQTMTEEFMELINNHRVSIGLLPLIHNDSMALIAEGHSVDMASGSVAFGHGGFSERCSEARAALGGGNLCAENVAMGQKTATAALNAWMNSSGHKANIEQARATHTGFGFKKNSSGTYYWTQIFLEFI